jgi:hypothetical protein
MPSGEHKWAEIAGSVDACVCIVCGMCASNTAIAAGAGVPTRDGWTTGEFASALPGCDEVLEGVDIDADFTRLLEGEL